MRIGITTPIVTALPGFFSDWERDAGIAELTRVAGAADRLGFDHLTCSEHVVVPEPIAVERGGTYWDPLVTLSHLAARTERIRLATQVLVLGLHHPLAVAKRYGTLDLVSGGRLVLGVGVGSIEQEFDVLGAQYGGRGAIADDALAALRAAWGERLPAYDGSHFSFSGLVVEPHAPRRQVPVWVGGYTPRSLRRATELGTGWVPFGLPHDKLAEMLAGADLPDDFDVVLGAGRPLDPIGDPDRALRAVGRAGAAGANIVTVHIAADSCEHYIDQLAALADLKEKL